MMYMLKQMDEPRQLLAALCGLRADYTPFKNRAQQVLPQSNLHCRHCFKAQSPKAYKLALETHSTLTKQHNE